MRKKLPEDAPSGCPAGERRLKGRPWRLLKKPSADACLTPDVCGRKKPFKIERDGGEWHHWQRVKPTPAAEEKSKKRIIVFSSNIAIIINTVIIVVVLIVVVASLLSLSTALFIFLLLLLVVIVAVLHFPSPLLTCRLSHPFIHFVFPLSS